MKVKAFESNSSTTLELRITEFLSQGIKKIEHVKYSTCEKGGYVMHSVLIFFTQ